MRDGAPSPQEEVERLRAAARIGFKARIAEAYTVVEAMLKDEERERLQSEAEEVDLPYEMAEDRYHGTTEEGAERNAVSVCGERMAEDKVENPIADSESRVWRSRAPQPETLDIGESNPRGVWAIGRKTAANREEPAAMNKSVNRKDDSKHLPTLAPGTMAVRPERPREPLEEEGGGAKI